MNTQATIRVMVVDDHPVVRIGLTAIINTEKNMECVAEAADGVEAVRLFRANQPKIALMDLRLPEMSGVEAIKAIRQEFPASRFIILTTYDGDEDIYRALRAGAQGYLLKGMKREQLVDAITAVHAGLRYIPTVIEQRLAERLPDSDLSPREMEVIELIVRGRSNREIAAELGIGEGRVKWFVNIILGKLAVRDRTQAATAALQRGIVRI
ncbi:MAG: response regulator transcription factor [Pyrinomonadaceae bacterium]|nr:response regulator transcription factor [Pyrinomonadaceae bacterium]